MSRTKRTNAIVGLSSGLVGPVLGPLLALALLSSVCSVPAFAQEHAPRAERPERTERTEQPADPQGVLWGVNTALAWFADGDAWSHLMGNAMAADFSWPRQVPHYRELYRSLL